MPPQRTRLRNRVRPEHSPNGWGVTGTGTVVPLAAGADGEVNDLTTVAGKWRVCHPDTEVTPAGTIDT